MSRKNEYRTLPYPCLLLLRTNTHAITYMQQKKYAYSAALQLGSRSPQILSQKGFQVIFVTIYHNCLIQRLLECTLVEMSINITVVSSQRWPQEIVGVAKSIHQCDSVWSNLRLANKCELNKCRNVLVHHNKHIHSDRSLKSKVRERPVHKKPWPKPHDNEPCQIGVLIVPWRGRSAFPSYNLLPRSHLRVR